VGAFVYVVVGTASFHPFPVVAVAVFIADGPAFSEGIGFKAPTGVAAGCGGGRYGGGSYAAAGNDFNIGCVILAEEVYGEVVGVACFEGVIVCTAAYITLAGSDPDTVAGSRVGKAPVISTCGYLDGNGVVNNNVAGGGAAVCIYGNLILECIVQTCGCVAALGERTFYGDLIAVCGCICIEEHLVTGTVAEYIACGEADGCHAAGCGGVGVLGGSGFLGGRYGSGLTAAGDGNGCVIYNVGNGGCLTAGGEVFELSDDESEIACAVCCTFLNAERYGADGAALSESSGGHHDAEAHGAGDGGGINKLSAAEVDDLVENIAASVGHILECISIIVELHVEYMCFESAVHGEVNGDFVAGGCRCGCIFNCEYNFAVCKHGDGYKGKHHHCRYEHCKKLFHVVLLPTYFFAAFAASTEQTLLHVRANRTLFYQKNNECAIPKAKCSFFTR